MTTAANWIARTLVLIGSWPALAASPDQLKSAVAISVYDLARIGAKTLAQAEDIATRIFMTAAIDTRWTEPPILSPADLLSDFSAVTGGECARPLNSADVRVQILSRAPSGFAPQALGYSLPCAERGVQVTIYADRVEAVASGTLAVFYRVLGYTLTHEIAHVLLRSAAHDRSGLMKGVWSKGDWQRAAVAIIPFTSDQARRMTGWLPRNEGANPVAYLDGHSVSAGSAADP